MTLNLRLVAPVVNSVISQIFTTQSFMQSCLHAGQLLILTETTPFPSPSNPYSLLS